MDYDVNSNSLKVYNNFAEFIMDIEDKRYILSPLSMVRFQKQLKEKIAEYEKEHGYIHTESKEQPFTQSLMKNLFYNKPVSKKLNLARKKS